MGNMSYQQMQNNLNMMSPEMMKNASNMIAGMNDSQIQMYLSQMGMTGIDPAMFRNMCQNMSNMNDSQFNSMKNMAQANFQNMENTNNSNNINNSNNTIVQKVTKIKEEGNNLFRNNKNEEAINKYYEAIEEIKTTTDKDKYKKELDNIERICRLNIAACKLKTKDYDGVINECSIVLETNKCFKAYYRMGLALMEKNKYDKAFRYLDNANAIGNASEKNSVEPYLKECKEKLNEIKKKEKEERIKKEMEEKNKEEKNNKVNSINNNEEIKENKNEEKIEDKKEEKKEIIMEGKKLDKKEEKKENVMEDKKQDNKINNVQNIIEQEKLKNKINKEKKEEEKRKDEDVKDEDDIKVEDTKNIKKSNNSYNYNPINNNNVSTQPPNLNQDYINQARNQINNMSDDQMNFMINQMKNMDNETLKNMMASQGMNISDQQIEMMKMSLTPETFKMLKDPNFNPPNMANSINNNNINNNINNNQSGNNNIPPQVPNLANMDFQQMMDYIRKNPELLKMISPQLSQMMGGKNIDPELMMKSMEKIMWIFSIPGRIKRFMLSWRGLCLIVFIIAIFYGLFKRK